MKNLIISLFLLTGCFLCSNELQLTEQIGGKAIISEGWANDDTYRVVARGVAKASLKGSIRRKIMSKEAAITMAQKSIIEHFKGVKIHGKSETVDGEANSLITIKEFEGIISGGNVLREYYDEEDNCEVIYQIYSPGLKLRINSTIR